MVLRKLHINPTNDSRYYLLP